jgi:adenylate cyclase
MSEMPHQVFIVQLDPTLTQRLMHLFEEQGYETKPTPTVEDVRTQIDQIEPELLVVDLHLAASQDWSELLDQLRLQHRETKLLFTSRYPDSSQELRVKEQYGARTFLRSPFTRIELEHTLQTFVEASQERQPSRQSDLPKVRIPVKIKITVPYMVLALALALGAAFIVSRIVIDTVEERFINQLIEAGKLTNDWLVQEEDRLLETLRSVAFTQGVAEALSAGDAERLRQYALPLAINNRVEALDILDIQGTSVLSLHHPSQGQPEQYVISRGETIYPQWPFVQNVLKRYVTHGRNKYAGMAHTPWGDFLYIAGPIVGGDGNLVGVVLIGKSLPTLVSEARQNTLAHTTIYNFSGQPIASTQPVILEKSYSLDPKLISAVLERQDKASLIRPLSLASIDYSETIGPWEVGEYVQPSGTSRSQNDLGLLGVALPETFLARPSQITRLQIFVLTAVAFLLIITLGVFVANRITRPLLQVVNASAEVAHGNLEVQIQNTGNDEVAILAHSFNHMVAGLREGSVYRDLLGRSVSPEVREELRRGFASGQVRLQGQEAVATILMSDIRGFTTLAELENPTTVMSWLNEYFEMMAPIITDHDGVISKFDGDAVLAFYGVLPRPLPAQESAFQACQTALAMLEAIKQLNLRRAKRGEPLLNAGIGINTGPVTAGALGAVDRLHYTIIGDTVNSTARLESLTRQFGNEDSAVISQHTLFALRERRHKFELEAMGAHAVKGKLEKLLVYRLKPAQIAVER